ncbi:hypothetical protein CR513_43679, partial [Mucuna pruriens]
MATLRKFSLMVLCLVISSALMVETGHSQEASNEEAEGPESSYGKYLANCASKLSQKCGNEIFSAIFYGTEKVSIECCDKLVNEVGKVCNDDMTDYILQLPKFVSKDVEILERSQRVWEDCVVLDYPLLEPIGHSYDDVSEPSESPSGEPNYTLGPLSSYEEYLNNCAARLYPNCGDEMFSAIFFGNQTVTYDCCFQLVNDVGKLCHDDMVKYILKLPEYGPNQTEILHRSEIIWNDCLYLYYPVLELTGADM